MRPSRETRSDWLGGEGEERQQLHVRTRLNTASEKTRLLSFSLPQSLSERGKFSPTSVYGLDQTDTTEGRDSSSLSFPSCFLFDGVCSVGREGRMCIHRGVEGEKAI